MPIYNRIPGVDEDYNLPPEIRAAFASSFEFSEALLAALQGSSSPLDEVLESLAIDPSSALVARLNQLVAQYPGTVGPAGEIGPAGSGVGPVVLGETIMTASTVAALAGATRVDWPSFSKTITRGTKPIVLKVSAHLQPTAIGTMSLAIVEGSTLIQSFNLPAPTPNVAYHIFGETITLSPSVGSHTYQVQIATTNGTVRGIATAPGDGYPAYLKVLEQ